MEMHTGNYEPRSGLGWIHFSDTDRQKVMQVLDLLKPQGTVDELGVGVVRDALADELFPGMTTLMTRAKYFVLVPRMIQDFIADRPPGVRAAEYLRVQENEAMNELGRLTGYEDRKGVIGVTFARMNKDRQRGRWLEVARKPSEMYWNGIRSYGIYTGQFSLANLLHQLDRKEKGMKLGHAHAVETGDDDDVELQGREPLFKLPVAERDWRTGLRMELTNAEAEFLLERITTTFGDRLLGLVLKDRERCRQFIRAKSFEELCDLPFVQGLPHTVRNTLLLAQLFWRLLEGAHIRYNVLLQELAGTAEAKGKRDQEWNDWTDGMRTFDWAAYEEQELWSIVARNGRLPAHTRTFITSWSTIIRSGDPDTRQLDALVQQQEQRNKGRRSKLLANPNEGTRYHDWVGISGMAFRFPQVRNILEDIHTGLE